MFVFEEMRKQKLSEAYDQKIQKLVYDLFQYLTVRGLKPGTKIPEFNETIRQKHAEQFNKGVCEFIESLENYINGYMRAVTQDEKKYKADYGSVIYDRIINGLKAFSKYA